MRKNIDPPTPQEYRAALLDKLQEYAPRVSPCQGCGWPSAHGWVCDRCGYGGEDE